MLKKSELMETMLRNVESFISNKEQFECVDLLIVCRKTRCEILKTIQFRRKGEFAKKLLSRAVCPSHFIPVLYKCGIVQEGLNIFKMLRFVKQEGVTKRISKSVLKCQYQLKTSYI